MTVVVAENSADEGLAVGQTQDAIAAFGIKPAIGRVSEGKVGVQGTVGVQPGYLGADVSTVYVIET